MANNLVCENKEAVDGVLDRVRKMVGDDGILVTGVISGNVKLASPTRNKKFFRVSGDIGFVPEVFVNKGAEGVGMAALSNAKIITLAIFPKHMVDLSDSATNDEHQPATPAVDASKPTTEEILAAVLLQMLDEGKSASEAMGICKKTMSDVFHAWREERREEGRT